MSHDYWIGIDGTDSAWGGCTTWTLSRLIRDLVGLDPEIVFLGYPRLIRLNPNVPYKTRGNAALALHIRTEQDISKITEIVKERISKDQSLYAIDTEKTAAMVISSVQPPEEIYDLSLQFLLEPSTVLDMCEPEYYWPENSQSLVGAIAAIAARLDDCSFELLAYRKLEHCGEIRQLENDKVKAAALQLPSTFSNYDHMLDRELVAPSGPDPVFVGIRGDGVEDLYSFLDILEISETLEYSTVFVSNQATGAYVKNSQTMIAPYQVFSGRVTLIEDPTEFQGGHVTAMARSQDDIVQLMWFEPTKRLRDGARLLIKEDNIQITAACVDGVTKVLHVESMVIVHAPEERILLKPTCECGATMSSAGTFSGYKCKECGRTSLFPVVNIVERAIFQGQRFYPSLGSQRHLLRPRSRIHKRNRYQEENLSLYDFHRDWSESS